MFPHHHPVKESKPISYTWLCRRCGRELHLSHKYRWIGEGKLRRRVCVECIERMSNATLGN